MVAKMVEVTYSLLELHQGIRIKLKFECVASHHKYKIIHREIKEDRKSASEKSALELELDISEFKEFQTMCTRPLVRNFLALTIVQLETVLNKIPSWQKSDSKEERKWPDIVAGRNSHTSGNSSTVIHNIETVITPRSSHPYKGNYEMETSEIIHSSTTRMYNKKHQDERPRIIVLGDSHARGFAGELLHQVK